MDQLFGEFQTNAPQNVQLAWREYLDKQLIGLRVHDQHEAGKWLSTTKRIALTVEQRLEPRDAIDQCGLADDRSCQTIMFSSSDV